MDEIIQVLFDWVYFFCAGTYALKPLLLNT